MVSAIVTARPRARTTRIQPCCWGRGSLCIYHFLRFRQQFAILLCQQGNSLRAVCQNSFVKKIGKDDGKGQPQDAPEQQRVENRLRGETVEIKKNEIDACADSEKIGDGIRRVNQFCAGGANSRKGPK